MKYIIDFAIKYQSSDILISENNNIKIRKNGVLLEHPDQIILSRVQIIELIIQLSNNQIKISDDFFLNLNNYNFAVNFSSRYRIRCNVFNHIKGITIVCRIIDNNIIPISELQDVPQILFNLPKYQSGLVIVAGKIGTGKSTTISSIIEHINRTHAKHIITFEDPIEFIYQSKLSLIHQLEFDYTNYTQEHQFNQLFRQDPDIVVIGEIRTTAQLKQALQTAEAGHLVITSMHGESATSIVQRLYHSLKISEIYLLAQNLKTIIAQKLLFSTAGSRVVNYEILINNNAIKNLILEGKISQLNNIINTCKQSGMMSFEQHLQTLISRQQFSKNSDDMIF
jgi:twitching motility protein PilT